MMKFIAIACFAAVAFAEPEADAKADPALLYSTFGYGGYPAYSTYGLRTYGFPAYTYGYNGYYGKRSADAEPEANAKADPALLYSTFGYGGYPAYSTYGLRTYGYPAYTYGYNGYYGKRSADAEPEADAKADPALLYSTFGYGGYPAYSTYGLRTYGYPAYTYGYNGYYGKRSADAEPEADAKADPALLYSTFGYGGYPAYSTYGYARYPAFSAYNYAAYRPFGAYSYLG